jgi:transposase-like protein
MTERERDVIETQRKHVLQLEMNLLQLSALVHDKASSVQFLCNRGILHNPRVCAAGHPMNLSLNDRQDRWRCTRGGCKEDVPLRRGTWLEGSNMQFRTIVIFVYCWSKNLTSIAFCDHELDIRKQCVIDWNNYLREVCADSLLRNPVVIGGPGMHVEVDESLFSRRKNNVGLVLPQQWVFGGVCRETHEVFLVAVPDRTAQTLLDCIRRHVLPQTTILSDEWAAYRGIQGMGMNLTHNTVNHTYNFIDPTTGAHTQTIESTWNQAKARNKRHFGTHRTMLDSYLCEFMFRRRNRGADFFDVILREIVTFWPPA